MRKYLKNLCTYGLVSACAVLFAQSDADQIKNAVYHDPNASIEDRVDSLVSLMTFQEKIDQLLQILVDSRINLADIKADGALRPTIGSVLSFSGTLHHRNEIQKTVIEKSRLGIPLIFGMDVIHGWRTTFPTPLAQSCSFNPELTRRMNRIAAIEAMYSNGVNWTFAPMLDIPHDPRWGRVVETFGEEPYVSAQFATAAVRGFQTDDPSAPEAIAACAKHFAGYAASEGGRDYSYSEVSHRMLWEYYFPPFRAAVDAGILTFMSSFNDIAGTPAVVNHYLLTEVLRNRWKFSGFVVSDWESVMQLAAQGFSKDKVVQGASSLKAGNDMDMKSNVYETLGQALDRKMIDMETIDTAVSRILRVKFELGLFENPYIEEKNESDVIRLPEYRDLGIQAAGESMVLLQNDGILPLNPDRVKSLALIGPSADHVACNLGAWSGSFADYRNPELKLRTHIMRYFPNAKINYAQGCDHSNVNRSNIPEAVQAAKDSDIVLLVLGENGDMSGEDRSRAFLNFPGRQVELANAVLDTGKPVILLVTSGRPNTSLSSIAPRCKAVLYMWECGCGAAQAACDILTGRTNPSGKLTTTFPRSESQIPIFLNQRPKARNGRDYHDLANGPLYPFGYGLSYTTFEYTDLKITALDGKFFAEVTVKNTGARPGKETVIWYISDPEATITQPVKRVISFEKNELQPGESRKYTVEIDPMRDLSYPDDDGHRILEPGTFVLSASDKQSINFILP